MNKEKEIKIYHQLTKKRYLTEGRFYNHVHIYYNEYRKFDLIKILNMIIKGSITKVTKQ